MSKLPTSLTHAILGIIALFPVGVLWAAAMPPTQPPVADTSAAVPTAAPASSQPGVIPPATPSGSKAASTAAGAKASVSVALTKKISVDFKDTSLDNVLKSVSELSGLNIVIDPDVSASGIDLDRRIITLKAHDISVKSVLKLLTFGSDLGWKEEPGYLLITTRDKMRHNLPLKSLAVNDLLKDPNQTISDLCDVIKCAVNTRADPDAAAWADEGGPASIEVGLDRHLLVSQTPRGHERIQDLLKQLRLVLAGSANPAVALAKVKPDPRLQKKITLDVQKTPLKHAVEIIDEKLGGVNLVVDPTVTGADTGAYERAVDLSVRDVTAESALHLILQPDLVHTVQPDYILVATAKRLPQELVTAVYPCPVRAAPSIAGGGAAGKSPEEEMMDEVMAMVRFRNVNAASDKGVAAWSEEGGPASIRKFRKAIIITQTRWGHEKVAELFKQLASLRPGAK